MKTPREILLSKHRAAEPRLDAIRRAVVKEMCAPCVPGPGRVNRLISLLILFAGPAWRELILPSRRTWAGLSAVWVLLLMLNVWERDPVSSVTGQPVREPAPAMSLQLQQRWLNELLADRSMPAEAVRPRDEVPKPRSQCEEVRLL